MNYIVSWSVCSCSCNLGTIQLVGPFVAVLVNKFGTRVVCIAGAVISATGILVIQNMRKRKNSF